MAKPKYVKMLQRFAFGSCLFFMNPKTCVYVKGDLPFPFDSGTDMVLKFTQDDVHVEKIKFVKDMKFLGNKQQGFFPNVNGIITFGESFINPRWIGSFPDNQNLPAMVAAYWTDIDMSIPGEDNEILVRNETNDVDKDIAQGIIRNCTGDDKEPLFSPDTTVVITYNKVNRYNQDPSVANTFQITFAYNQISTWVILAYEQLEFFSSERSVQFSLTGFNGGQEGGGNFKLPVYNISNDNNMTSLLNGDNTGIPGVYAYRVYEEAETCDLLCQVFCWLGI